MSVIGFYEEGALVNVDVDATRRMYSFIDHGETEDCSCGYCSHFAEHRDDAYTPKFRALLERLGIDAAKENETWAVEESEWCLFHGDFDFVGTVINTPPEPHKGRPIPAYDRFDYGFADGAGYPSTQKRATELGFEPIASVWFTLWLPVPATGFAAPRRG